MTAVIELKTQRLLLRDWRDADLPPFAALNADPRVMRHFPAVATREESDAMAARIRAFLSEHGWGPWAAEWQGEFVGFVGLSRPRFQAHFTPCVELGWRLAHHAQGQGLATEAAKAVLEFALKNLPDERLVSFTVPGNTPSRRVMEKLGLSYVGDFEHPRLPEGHPLRTHVLYRFLPNAVAPGGSGQSTKKSGVGSTLGST